MRQLRAWLAATLTFVLGACQPAPVALPEQAYIWQREWSGAHAEALRNSRDLFSGFRVLAAQMHSREGLILARADTAMLAADGRPVFAVFRLDGDLVVLDAETLIGVLSGIVANWRSAHVNVIGIEIDYDCATAKLPGYGSLVSDLRRGLPKDLVISITALPTWIGSPDLPPLLGHVDQAVLQVHSVLSPEQGLFDAERARRWISGFADSSPVPFWIALPAYGAGLVRATDGALSVESETPLPMVGVRQELRVDPDEMAQFLRALEVDRPRGMLGVVWFRLPLSGDRRAWALPTLRAVILGVPLSREIAVQLRESGPARDLVVRNIGNLDVDLPAEVIVTPGDCSAADALAGYLFEKKSAGLAFRRIATARLAAGSERVIGWLRCRDPDTEVVNVAH